METSKTRWVKGCAIALLLVVLGGCESKPLPEDKKNYAGDWRNSNITLKIFLDGRVEYKKEEGNRKTSIKGPITEFNKDNFVVGFWILETTFEVQKTPFQEGERWAMVVDRNKLYKVN